MLPRIARGDAPRSSRAALALPVAGAVFFLIGYPLFVRGPLRAQYPLVAEVLAPLLLSLMALFVVPTGWRMVALFAAAVMGAVAVTAGGSSVLAYAPPVAINLALAALFGATLRPGNEPLIQRFARLERGVLEPDLEHYTRTVTGIWTGFFLVMAGVSVALAALPDPVAWQWFTALGNWACVAALFVGEWIYRRLRFAHYRHASPWQLLLLVCRSWRA